jgi:predicted dinucleotide-binding enzyme
LAKELGSSVFPQNIQEAYQGEIIFLAVPFPAYNDVAKQFKQWNGKIVVDLLTLRMPFVLLRKTVDSWRMTDARKS